MCFDDREGELEAFGDFWIRFGCMNGHCMVAFWAQRFGQFDGVLD